MFSNASAIYGAKCQSRSIAALLGDSERHRFLLGTTGLRENNEVLVLEFNEETNELSCDHSFSQPGEVWSVSPSPRDASLLFTSHGSPGGAYDTTLWRLTLPASPSAGEDDDRPPSPPLGEGSMDRLLVLPKHKGRVRSVLWGVSEEAGGDAHAVTIDDNKLRYWTFDGSHSSVTETGSVKISEENEAIGAAWDPHETSRIATVQHNSLAWWDLRTFKMGAKVDQPHKAGIRDVDFNPNKPFILVTCGDDRLIKFWDSRKLNQPVKNLAGHTHWVWTVKYNRCHDQLLLSAGTDSLVNLWRVSSISSAPLLESEDPSSDSPDRKVKAFDEHEESVYSVAWSACDPFVFVSVSYDGRVVLNHVPSTEKYAILL